VAEYDARAADPFRQAAAGDPGQVVDALLARMDRLALARRYEEAAVARARLAALLRASVRMQRLAALTGIAELVAARPATGGGWELAIVRHGRLAAAGTSPPRVHPRPTIDLLRATAETVLTGPGPTPSASAEETERILAWLERPETRLVRTTTGWASPVRGAGRFRDLLRRAESAGRTRDSSDRP
jgi:DNA polymerase-3 subunit epsilon